MLVVRTPAAGLMTAIIACLVSTTASPAGHAGVGSASSSNPTTSTTIASATTTTATTVVPTTVVPTTVVRPPDHVVPTTVVPAAPPPATQIAGTPVGLQPWVDLPLLTAMAPQPGTAASYLTSQSGEVWRFVEGAPPQLVLDLTGVVSPYVNASERGLLGIAFNPVDGRLFVSYTDGNIDSHVVSYAVAADGRPDPTSALEVIFVDQPGLGHKGGGLAFEPNGTLLLALGDGGASNGRDAQDMTKLLGGIVRIVPRAGAAGYEIPTDNPYIGQPSIPPEIWAKGLRNPWGFCRDTPTGNLWLADVGNHTMEEVDRLGPGIAGANFGWPFVEGTDVRRSGAPANIVAPVHAYRHDEVGPAAIGGCVYRGTAIPALAGSYLFGDLSGPLFAVGAADEVVRLAPAADGIVTGFGTRPDGEMVVLTLDAGAMLLVPG